MLIERDNFLNIQNKACFLVSDILRCGCQIKDITIDIPEKLFSLSFDSDHGCEYVVEDCEIIIKVTPELPQCGPCRYLKIILRERQTNLNEFAEKPEDAVCSANIPSGKDALIMDYRIARSLIFSIICHLGPLSVNWKTVRRKILDTRTKKIMKPKL